jgi:hypothetical protein
VWKERLLDMKEKYYNEWPKRPLLGERRNHGRKKLNVIIRLVNEWSLNYRPDDQVAMLLRRIDMGLQTFAKISCEPFNEAIFGHVNLQVEADV